MATSLFRLHGKRSAQARIGKPGRRRQRWKPDRGETPQGVRCAARERDRPCLLAGDARISRLNKHYTLERPHTHRTRKRVLRLRFRLLSGRAGAAGSVVFDGCQASRGGDSPHDFPLEGRRRKTGIERSRKSAPPRKDDAPKPVWRDQFTAGTTIDCNWSMTPGSTKTQACLSSIGILKTWTNNARRRWASRPVR